MNIVRVEIASEPVIPGKSGISQKTNKPYTIPTKQKAYMHGVARYPVEFEVAVQEENGPYRPGFYLLGGECFVTDQYGLQFSDRDLILVSFDDAAKQLVEPKAKAA